MAITREGNQNNQTTDNSTSVVVATTGNITNGSLVVVCAIRFSPSSDPIVVGDISKTAGTATIGAWTLDKQIQAGSGADFQNAAIFSALCTGTGSITVTVAGAPAGSYWVCSIGSYTSGAGWDSSRVEQTNSNNGTGTAVDSGNATSAGQALFVGDFAMDSSSDVTITEDGAFTRIFNAPTGSAHECGGAEDKIVTSGNTDSASWTITSNLWAATVVVYKEVAAADSLLGQIWI